MTLQIVVSDNYPINRDNSKTFEVNCKQKIIQSDLFIHCYRKTVYRNIFIKPVEYYLKLSSDYLWIIDDTPQNIEVYSNTNWIVN